MHGVKWGDVPAWVASILTGGSLLLGFWILLRDHRMRDRAQIDQFAFWVKGDNSDDRHTAVISIQVRNAGVLPVKGLHIKASADIYYLENGEVLKVPAEGEWDVLGPGESDNVERTFPLSDQAARSGRRLEPGRTSIDYVDARPVAVRVLDNSGREWVMGKHELLRRARRRDAR